MKPISVRFRCFGPYIEEQTIRFDELAEHGLFLICGETGSGKTTILDAMCCALYGSCSGEIRGELDAKRCRQARPEDPTEVDFIFECGGKRYRFSRKLTPRKSRKADAETTYNEDYSCGTESDGVWIPLLDNAKKKAMNAKAEELLGLNLNQFRQVIILPQGRFETLLTSGSEDKESILSSLFHTERWKTAVERMADELNSRRDEIARESQTIQEGLNRLQAGSVAELPEALKAAEQAAECAAEAEKAAEEAKKQAQALLNLNDDYRELDKRREKLESSRKAAADDHAVQVRLEMAQKAEKARRPHDEWDQAGEALKQADTRLKETEDKLGQAEETLKKAKEARDAHELLAGEQEKRSREVQRLASLRERYLSISSLQKAADARKKELAAAETEKERAERTAKGEKERLQELETAWNNAEDAYKLTARAYRAAAAGNLAAVLQEGEPCPVCGSTHHPHPARLPEGAVESRDVEAAEKEVTRARKAYEIQKGRKEKEEEAWRKAEQSYQEARTAYDTADGTLRQELAWRDPELETLEDLDRRSRELDGAVRDYNDKKEKLSAAYNQAVAARDTLNGAKKDRQTDWEQAGTAYREKEKVWLKALAETGLGTEIQYNAMILAAEEQQKLQKTLSDHQAELGTAQVLYQEQQEKLEGKERPEPETAAKTYEEADLRHKASIQEKTIAEQKRENLRTEIARLTALDAKIAERRNAYEEDNAFVRALRGSTGMSIQRYVLSVRLGQVIVEANRLLSGIYGGRYRLHRSNESYGSSHKSGLELEVYDSQSDQRRSVCTLSGGEKFLVALSLAIGLCTVVQNEQKGVNLEAMFIDEGFGSLDQNTLGDALDVLQGVQRGHGLVGIISHVPLLEETILTKIEIRKTAHGSVTKTRLG